jgi:hypothetical protein
MAATSALLLFPLTSTSSFVPFLWLPFLTYAIAIFFPSVGDRMLLVNPYLAPKPRSLKIRYFLSNQEHQISHHLHTSGLHTSRPAADSASVLAKQIYHLAPHNPARPQHHALPRTTCVLHPLEAIKTPFALQYWHNYQRSESLKPLASIHVIYFSPTDFRSFRPCYLRHHCPPTPPCSHRYHIVYYNIHISFYPPPLFIALLASLYTLLIYYHYSQCLLALP